MRLLGFDISISRLKAAGALQAVDNSRGGGWWPIIRESSTGSWQTGTEVTPAAVLTYSALYACVTLIAADISKMRLRLVEQDREGVWSEVTRHSPYWPVLRRPNHVQNRIQFTQWWIVSKLLAGNAYALKQRDERGIPVKLYLLDPSAVSPLIAPDGSVFYELRTGDSAKLAGLASPVIVPAREILHDVMVPLFHPLVGVTPIYACGTAAIQGLKIQANSTTFFANGSQPGGVLSAPGTIAQETADRVKTYWEQEFGGNNVGKVAVLGDGLKYEPMTVKAVDAQLIEQLRWTGETVCSAYHVPPYMVGVGTEPTYANAEIRTQQYYSQCLQTLIESMELVLDEGLELPTGYGTEFDLSDLLRMDSATQMDVAVKGVGGGILTPNEARAAFSRTPLPGGNTVYLQQQYDSLEALNKRDTAEPAPPTPEPEPTGTTGGTEPAPPDEPSAEEQTRAVSVALMADMADLAQKYAQVIHADL